MAAYRRARALGAVEVELDVQLSRDDEVMLFHDDTLDRKTGHAGRVRDLTRAELEALDIGTWFDETHPAAADRFAGAGLDGLDALFAELGRQVFYHVELKAEEPELPARTLAIVDRFGLRDRVMVTSFHLEQLERMRALAPELPTCLLIRDAGRRTGSISEWIDRAAAAGMREVGVEVGELDREHVQQARRRGLWIRAWGVGSEVEMERAIAVGSNGMTIDWPEKLIRRWLDITGTPGRLGP